MELRNKLYKCLSVLSYAVILTSFTPNVYSQAPPNIKWQKIDAGKYEVVYPPELKNEAAKLGNILLILDSKIGNSLGHDAKKITIILDNVNSFSNGYVTLSPRYSRFYHTPPSDGLFYEDWTLLLGIHELRHVVQIDKLDTGFGHVYYILFGESGLTILRNLVLPRWFTEGDSVYMETLLSNTGRGRLPEFSMLTRTLLLSDSPLSYSTAYYGSYIKATPGPYELGYLLVSYVRKKYGEDTWQKILTYTAKYSFFPPWLFTRALKKYTGKTKGQLYKEAIAELKQYWQRPDIKSLEVNRPINAPQKIFTEYRHPSLNEKDELYAMKKGVFHQNSLVKIIRKIDNPANGPTSNENNKLTKENTIKVIPGYVRRFSHRGEIFVWAEQIPGVRFDTSRSVIKRYHEKTKKTTILKHTLNLKIPTVSPNGTIATTGFDKSARGFLTFWNTQGELTQTYEFARGNVPVSISWGNSSKRLTVITQTLYGRNLYFYEMKNKKLKLAFKNIPAYFDSPFLHKNRIFFHGTFNGIDNIFVYDLVKKKFKRVTNVRFGAFDPFVSANGKLLYYTDFDVNGRSVVKKKINPAKWKTIKPKTIKPVLLEDKPASETITWNENDFTQTQFSSTAYFPFLNAINIHSWSFLPRLYGSGVDLSVLSSDKLNTLDSYAVTGYSENEEYVYGGFLFKGWFPVIGLNAGYFNYRNAAIIQSGNLIPVSWSNTRADVSITLPMRYSSGLWNSESSLTGTGGISQRSNYKESGVSLPSYNNSFYLYSALFSHRLYKEGNKNLFSPSPFFEIDWLIKYEQSLRMYDNNLESKYFVNNLVRFPGFSQNHTIQFNLDYNYTASGGYNIMQMPRGYMNIFVSNGLTTRLNYTLPLIYTDVNLIPGTLFLYCKVIKLNLFYDHSMIGNYQNISSNYRSTGAEIIFEIIPFDLGVPLLIGAGAAYLIDLDQVVYYPYLNLALQVSF